MLTRFERIDQMMLEGWNRHRLCRAAPKTCYLIPGKSRDVEEDNFLDNFILDDLDLFNFQSQDDL